MNSNKKISLRGEITVPGDKSISHRAIMFGSIAKGTTEETVTTKSTKGGEIRVEICSKCHPFFTGKQKFVDAGGRLDKFKKRLERAGK